MASLVNIPRYRLPARLVHMAHVVHSFYTKDFGRQRPNWELLLMQRGSQLMQVDDNDIHLQAGQALVLPPTALRQTQVSRDGSCLLLVCTWQGWSPVDGLQLLDDSLGRIQRCCRQILDLNQPEQEPQRHLFLNLMLHAIVDELREPGGSDQKMAWLRGYIERNHAVPLEMAFLANHVNLSTHQMSRRFVAAYGCTPYRYLQDVRVQHAEALIHEAGLTISEAAKRVNFGSVSNLGRRLRERSTGKKVC